MQFDQAAFKHGKTREDVEFLYASFLTEWFDNGLSERGNERAMLVCFDFEGNLMEAALELTVDKDNNDEEYFYHAMKATPEWQKRYKERRRHDKR